ncbi:MAG: DUF3857 domain-containing protein [Spirochaetes bacterium]|nr:DUF3857 domain-containing protein [Spirochaetota bacterium]
MKNFFRKTVLPAVLLIIIPFTSVLPQNESDYLVKYYQSYKKGNLFNAVDALFEQLMTENSRLAFCSGITAMISSFPDLSRISELENMLIRLRSGSNLSSDHEARNLLDNVILGIELMKGNFPAAEKMKKNSGWVENYKIAGPFSFTDLSGFIDMDTGFLKNKQFLNSRNLQTGWTDIRSGRDGDVDFNYLFRRQEQDVYFAEFAAKSENDGKYYMYICKTGPFELFVDGVKIFNDYSQHKSFPGQYVAEIDLKKGVHTVLVKLSGNNENEAAFGIQMTDSNFEPVETSLDMPQQQPEHPSAYTVRPGLGLDLSTGSQDEKFLINQGMFLQIIDYQNNGISASTYLNRIQKESPFYSFAQTLCSAAESSPEKKDFYLRNAIKADPLNDAARYQLFSMLLYNGFVYDAEKVMNDIFQNNKNSIFAMSAEISFYIEKDWNDRAYEKLEQIGKKMSIGDKLMFEAMIEKKNYNYSRLLEIYRELNGLNRYSRNFAESLLECMNNISSPAEISAQAALFSYVFYNNTVFNHTAAMASLNERADNRALTYLAAAAKKCSHNSYTDFYLSRVYEMTGRKDLALFHLKQASVMNPSENYFSEYYDFVNKNKDPLLKYKDDADLKELSASADVYDNEPAVMLFDENVEKVMSDGSVLKSVRKAYKIFNPDNVKPLMQQNFVFSPSDDKIISVSCVVETNGEAVHVNNMNYQQLSSPESRLYYDSTAAVITIPELMENSIIYFNYVIHSKSDSEYRGYYSSTKRFDTRYRILRAVNRIAVPLSMKLTYQLKNSSGADFRHEISGNEIIYSYVNNNIISAMQEQKMTPASERYPSVSFSSFNSWKSFHQWYRQLFEKQIVMSEQMKTEIDEVVSKSRTDEEKIEAVYQYITDRTRYVGYEIGIGGIKPRRSDIVYQTRMGDCKDIALLLTAVFRYLKMDAALALVITADSGFTDEKFASISNFNHAVCRVNLPGKGLVFLDGTVKKAGPKELVDSDKGTVSLVLDEKSFNFVKIENSYYFQSLEQDVDDVEIYENGNAHIVKKALKTNDAAIRLRIMNEGNVNIETRISRSWNSIFPASVVSGFSFTSLDLNKPVEYKYNVDVKGFSEIVGSEMFIPVVSFKYGFLQSYGLAPDRAGDIYISETKKYENSFIYTIPLNYEISRIPSSKELSFGGNRVNLKFETDAGDPRKIIINYNLYFERGVIPPSEYRKFRQYILEIEKIETLKIALKKKAVK